MSLLDTKNTQHYKKQRRSLEVAPIALCKVNVSIIRKTQTGKILTRTTCPCVIWHKVQADRSTTDNNLPAKSQQLSEHRLKSECYLGEYPMVSSSQQVLHTPHPCGDKHSRQHLSVPLGRRGLSSCRYQFCSLILLSSLPPFRCSRCLPT